jgi:pyruvate dehydrogenase E1 component alpha subunit
MPRKTLNEFHIDRLSILDERGQVDPDLNPRLPAPQLKKIFENMIYTREFDQRALSLQRQGRIGTFAPAIGQEAIGVGAAAALEKRDWVVPCFREQGVYLSRGVKPSTLYIFFMGSEEGNRLPRSLNTLPYCIPCASQLPHAVGIALAAKYKKDSAAVLTFLGDGATSEGDFHEALNFAAVYQAPVVFICQNNQWAISTPVSQQSHSSTLAQKAIAYGMEGLQVDGNDVLAVYAATQQALDRARRDQGPSFLECVTYRVLAHTTADDPGRYRDAAEVQNWQAKDPIDRLEKYLVKQGLIQPKERSRLEEQFSQRLKAAALEAEAVCQRLSPDEMFTYMYHRLPDILRPQMEEALQGYTEGNKPGAAHG